MKKVLIVLPCFIFMIVSSLQSLYAQNSTAMIYNYEDLRSFISYNNEYQKAQLHNNITISDSIHLTKYKQFDMNGYSFTIPKNRNVCIKSDEEDKNYHFYTTGNQPIFIVQGILELYNAKLESTGYGTLIKVKDNGQLYTKRPFLESKYYPNDEGINIGNPSIYDNQVVSLTIPNGTAIESNNESAYYHLNIKAKKVIESQVKPIFYYSTIQSKQVVEVKQGVYNDIKNIKNIPIWKHQLVMGIDDDVTEDNIDKYLPTQIATKDSEYITIHFDTSSFDKSLSEQTLVGEYHNINPLYISYLPKLEIKIFKNKKVPISQFYTKFSESCLPEIDPSIHPTSVKLYVNTNYINSSNIILEYSQNINFINYETYELDTWGYDYCATYPTTSLTEKETLYFRLHILDGLQEGYSNIIKIDKFKVYYMAEPDSKWQEVEENQDGTIVTPAPPIDNDKTETPDTLPDDGNDHRNDSSIDKPSNKSEIVIKKEEVSSNIKAKKDILIDLKKYQVIIPYETAKKYENTDINVIEKENTVEISSNKKEINESTILIQKQVKPQSYSYIGYIIVIGGVIVSIFCFFKYQRRVK